MALTYMAYCFSIKAAKRKSSKKMKTYASGQQYLATSLFRMEQQNLKGKYSV